VIGDCRNALALSESPDPLQQWYPSAGERRALVFRSFAEYFGYSDHGAHKSGLQQCGAGSDAACTELLRSLPPGALPRPLAYDALAVAYLPPRGAARGVGLRDEPFRQTTARLRAQALAAQWRTASLALRLPEYRKRLQPELLRRRERDEPGPALLVEAPDSVAAFARQRLRATLDTVSGQLGLGVTKVSVGLVVDLWRYVSANAGETPSQDFESPGYLFPDSSDRTTCVALIPAWRWTGTLAVQPQVRHQRVEDMLRTALGPCAFYAAYGTPGRGVRHWLAKRGYDLARVPLWDRAQDAGRRVDRALATPLRAAAPARAGCTAQRDRDRPAAGRGSRGRGRGGCETPSSLVNTRLPAVIAVGLALLVATPARAQGDRWERQVRGQLERAAASLVAKGAVRSLATRVGMLDTDESASFTLTLQAGVSYVVMGPIPS